MEKWKPSRWPAVRLAATTARVMPVHGTVQTTVHPPSGRLLFCLEITYCTCSRPTYVNSPSPCRRQACCQSNVEARVAQASILSDVRVTLILTSTAFSPDLHRGGLCDTVSMNVSLSQLDEALPRSTLIGSFLTVYQRVQCPRSEVSRSTYPVSRDILAVSHRSIDHHGVSTTGVLAIVQRPVPRLRACRPACVWNLQARIICMCTVVAARRPGMSIACPFVGELAGRSRHGRVIDAFRGFAFGETAQTGSAYPRRRPEGAVGACKVL